MYIYRCRQEVENSFRRDRQYLYGIDKGLVPVRLSLPYIGCPKIDGKYTNTVIRNGIWKLAKVSKHLSYFL